MDGLWPWLAVMGAGALHGLNPCNGWALIVGWRGRERAGGAPLQALLSLGLGHVASICAVAVAVSLGLGFGSLPLLAGAGVAGLAVLLWRRQGRQAGIALWSFTATTLQGSGLMLVPSLLPLCLNSTPAREITASGSMALALAAMLVHLAAMLLVMGLPVVTIRALRQWFNYARQPPLSRRPVNICWLGAYA